VNNEQLLGNFGKGVLCTVCYSLCIVSGDITLQNQRYFGLCYGHWQWRHQQFSVGGYGPGCLGERKSRSGVQMSGGLCSWSNFQTSFI